MKKFLLASIVFCASVSPGAWAQAPAPVQDGAEVKQAPAAAQDSGTKPTPAPICDSCGVVQQVHQEKRKGKAGSGVGVVGGAVVGGLVGNQFGGGTGKTLATIGGAVAGGFAGNEVEKHATSKTVWVTTVKMKDGKIRTFEQEAQPGWAAGNTVKVKNKKLSRV
jgi:outer membrane lipoprotein SlyB